MKTTRKRLSPAQKRQRILCDRRATELKQIPTPELLPMAAKALEYLL